MISFVVFVSCVPFLLCDLNDYCYALGTTLGSDCEYDFLCVWAGSDGCEADENAEVSYTPIDCTGKEAACTYGTYNYFNGAATIPVYYTISNLKTFANIDPCSVDFTISNDLDGAPYCEPTNCGIVNYGVDAVGAPVEACFDYCYAYPTECAATTCPATTATVCCATTSSNYCTDYCQTKGTSENCCGGPATHASIITGACTGYINQHPDGTTAASYHTCISQPNNLTACALCTSYYSCCSQYKSKATSLSASICDHFCALKPADKDCEKRKQCLDSLGHPPSEAELAKCGTAMVRLSSFTVAVLLGVMAFFFLA